MSELAAAARPFLWLRGMAMASGVASAVLIARGLGPEARGQFAIVVFVSLTAAAVLGIGSPLGMYDAVRRGMPERHALRFVMTLGGVTAALLIVAGAMVYPFVAPSDRLAESAVAVCVAIAAAGIVISQASGMVLLAAGHTWLAALVQTSQPMIALLLYLTVWLLPGFTLTTAVIAFAFASASAAAVGMVAGLSVREEVPLRSEPASIHVASALRRGLKAMPGDIANLLSYRLDILFVAVLAGPASLGAYAVGVQLLEPLWLAASALAMGLMGVARSDAASDRPPTISAARAASVASVMGCFVMTLAVWAVGPLLLGPGYESVPIVMLALTLGIGALAVSKVVAASVVAAGHIGMSSLVAGTTVGVNSVLNLVLVPSHGEVGAALASSISYLVSAAFWIRVMRRQDPAMAWADVVPRRSDLHMLRGLLSSRRPVGA